MPTADEIPLDSFLQRLGQEVTRRIGATVVASGSALNVVVGDQVVVFDLKVLHEEVAEGRESVEGSIARILSGLHEATAPITWESVRNRLRLRFIPDAEILPNLVVRSASPVLKESIVIDRNRHFQTLDVRTAARLGRSTDELWQTAVQNSLNQTSKPEVWKRNNVEFLAWVGPFGAESAWLHATTLHQAVCATPSGSLGFLLPDGNLDQVEFAVEVASRIFLESADRLTPNVHIFAHGKPIGTALSVPGTEVVLVFGIG